jgi:hypothetical protein
MGLHDSPLEGDGFEPSAPHKKQLFGCPSSAPQFTFRNKNRLFRAGDRWFESISLQRRVSNKTQVQDASWKPSLAGIRSANRGQPRPAG